MEPVDNQDHAVLPQVEQEPVETFDASVHREAKDHHEPMVMGMHVLASFVNYSSKPELDINYVIRGCTLVRYDTEAETISKNIAKMKKCLDERQELHFHTDTISTIVADPDAIAACLVRSYKMGSTVSLKPCRKGFNVEVHATVEITKGEITHTNNLKKDKKKTDTTVRQQRHRDRKREVKAIQRNAAKRGAAKRE